MTADSLMYVLAIYWPYMVAAGVVGLGAGGFSFARPKG